MRRPRRSAAAAVVAPNRARHRNPADRLGFRRIESVQIVLDDQRSRAFVLGVVHRLPRVVPVPWCLAAEIARSGVPVRTIDRRR